MVLVRKLRRASLDWMCGEFYAKLGHMNLFWEEIKPHQPVNRLSMSLDHQLLLLLFLKLAAAVPSNLYSLSRYHCLNTAKGKVAQRVSMVK